MSFNFKKEDQPDPNFFLFREWIETTGNGGWASSSLAGANLRRYHGLFISGPLNQRMVLLSKLEETVLIKGQNYTLVSSLYEMGIYPPENGILSEFRKDLFPEWIYTSKDFSIKKSILGLQHQNSILIKYEILEGSETFQMEFTPKIAARDYHSLAHSNSQINPNANLSPNAWSYQAYGKETQFELQSNSNWSYEASPSWYYKVFYPGEMERGQDFLEDLFSPGILKMNMVKGGSYYILISSKGENTSMMEDLWNQEIVRRESLLKKISVDEITQTLILAADQFIIQTPDNLNSIIAGYHWFLDWGRDTMISLPGLCLSTFRFTEAKKILQTFAGNIFQGIIPNRFTDIQGKPEYNTADATLWFFVACYRYFLATDDPELIQTQWLGIFESIMDWHIKGTLFNIHADHDSLLYQGESGVQLTWMDAKVGDWVVTPRTGKAVEINALWYNAHQIFAFFLDKSGQLEKASYYRKGAQQLQGVFIQKFWDPERQYLYDVIDGDFKDSKFRPNQIFAISLPFPLVSHKQAKSILDQIRIKLYTPKGLRTLSPEDPEYCPYYSGDQYHRDQAYHQGTAWSWLLGPYIDAIMKVEPSDSGRKEAKEVISNLLPHFMEAGIGTVSEIFDGNEPYYPKGCIGQAWGVAEILRVYTGYRLYE